MSHDKMRKQGGFTLIELILVITIIGILAGVVALSVHGTSDRARRRAAKAQIRTFETALSIFDVQMGRYPTADEGLKALIVNPDGSEDWAGPYLNSKTVPLDPWKHPYVYDPSGTRGMNYDLYSIGKDGQAGTDDDIGNWDSSAQSASQQ